MAPATPLVATAARAELEAAFRAHVEALQYPPDCDTAPLYIFVPHKFASGIGSQLRVVANSMMQSIVAQRAFVLDDAIAHSIFVDPKRCASRGYGCLFEPASRCTVLHAQLGNHSTPPNRAVNVEMQVRHGNDSASLPAITCATPRQSGLDELWRNRSRRPMIA